MDSHPLKLKVSGYTVCCVDGSYKFEIVMYLLFIQLLELLQVMFRPSADPLSPLACRRHMTLQMTNTSQILMVSAIRPQQFLAPTQSQVTSDPQSDDVLHGHTVYSSLSMQCICSCSLQTSPCAQLASYSLVTLMYTREMFCSN
jgi:hypothetical protein